MKTPFKTILEIISRVTESSTATSTLFQEEEKISLEDKQQLEEWSGKSIEQAKNILSIGYGKRQILFNPFIENNYIESSLIFSKFDKDTMPDIFYSCETTDFGQIIIASTDKGVCFLVFFSGEETKVPAMLQKEFPGSTILKGTNKFQEAALSYLNGDRKKMIHLHVKGSAENLQIWEALTRVPFGKLISYGTLAKATHHMAQDIGVAMGDNRIAMLIPCHRVIKSTGELGQYHWGAKRKQAMILKEAQLA